MKSIKSIVYGALALTLNTTWSSGSILQIINSSELPIDVIIQPNEGEGNENADFPEIHRIVHPIKALILEVEPKHLGKPETFSVIGKVNFYSLSQRCSELNFSKNYIITLAHKLNGGVNCLAVEVAPPHHNEQRNR